MQYIRPPFGPSPSSSITSSKETSSLISARKQYFIALKLKKQTHPTPNEKKKTHKTSQAKNSTYPWPQDSQNFLQQDLGSQYELSAAWFHSVDTN